MTESIALADLPRFADSPQAASEGFRAALQQREVNDLRSANAEMRHALLTVLNEVTAGHRPYSTDSYLPEQIVAAVRRALATGGRP